MIFDLGSAFARAQAGINRLVAAVPDLIVALVVFGGFFLVAALVTDVFLVHDHTDIGDGDRARQHERWPAGNTDVPASRKGANAIRYLSRFKPRGADGE